MKADAQTARRSGVSPVTRRWLPLSLTLLIALIGYFGAWLPHRAAGLVITGLDLAEYVKFIPQVASGQIALRRELFYLPLLAGSLTAGWLATRRELPRGIRAGFWLAAIPLALAMLPPAWSPGRLRLPEFRLQMLAIVLCLANLLLLPLLRRLPNRLVLALIALLSMASLAAAWGYLQVRPAIAELYRANLALGWGFWANLAGHLATALLAVVELLRPIGPPIARQRGSARGRR